MRCESNAFSLGCRLGSALVAWLAWLPVCHADEPQASDFSSAATSGEDRRDAGELRAELRAIRARLERIERLLTQSSEPPAPATTAMIVDGLRIHHDTPIARLANGKTVPLGNGHHIFIDVPKSMQGRSYTRRNGYQGNLRFDVLETQTVWLALYGADWGGGGNPSGNWQHEVVTQDQLEQQGWKPMGQLAVRHSHAEYPTESPWLLFSRSCEAGESFLIRNHKYQAPVLIWGPPAMVE
jgi:hypothetical protein